jgi:glyoxylase-like metal-dependent hydrolase (beta-lactamase superfamily II)
MQGEMQPTVYRFKFGGFEIANILDSKVIRDGLHPGFGGNQPADAAQELARANHIETNRFEHPFIPTIVNTGKQLVLFDTGNGALRREHEQLRSRLPDGHLVERLAQAGYKAEDIDVVVITHGHPDHIGGLTEGGKPMFPRARYVFGTAEFDFWRRGDNVREARKFNRELFMEICEPLADRSTFIKPGDEVVPGVHSVDAAGHSIGMMAYHIESEGKRLLVWATPASPM